MRIRKSFEQAICILLLIGTSEGPLKSHELSKKLDVSDSYLKKVTRHLVDKVFDPALNIHHTEDIIMNHLNAAENQYKQKLKEINLGEITNYVHQNSI